MAGIIFAGIPFVLGQTVGGAVDVHLVSIGRSIWPFHGLCLAVGILVGIYGRPQKHHGAPTHSDFTLAMVVAFLAGLTTSFLTYGCWRVIWKACRAISRSLAPSTGPHPTRYYAVPVVPNVGDESITDLELS